MKNEPGASKKMMTCYWGNGSELDSYKARMRAATSSICAVKTSTWKEAGKQEVLARLTAGERKELVEFRDKFSINFISGKVLK